MKKTEKDVVDEIKKEEKPTRKRKAKKEDVVEEVNTSIAEKEVKTKKTKKDKQENESITSNPNEENNKFENSEETEKDKLAKIVSTAKAKGKITYGELAAELGEANSEQIDKVFEAFEEIGKFRVFITKSM